MSSKICNACKKTKNKEKDFYLKGYKCKDCLSEFNKNRRHQLRKKLFEYCLNKGCNRCGERDVCTLQAHHLKPKEKYMKVSDMVSSSYKWDKIAEELAKCEILCANCHARQTAKDFNWYDGII